MAAKKTTRATKKSKPGRKEKCLTPAELAKVEQYAFEQCQDRTIAKLIGWHAATLKKHYCTVLEKKRAEGKAHIRHLQFEWLKKHCSMAIFLGKNYLGQQDKVRQDIPALMSFAEAMEQAVKRQKHNATDRK